jgi:RNA polymerase sigma-70 factor (family 1)
MVPRLPDSRTPDSRTFRTLGLSDSRTSRLPTLYLLTSNGLNNRALPKYYHHTEAFAAFRAGNENGLHYFFNLYYSPLVLYAGALTKGCGQAEDIVVESFIKLWSKKQNITEWKMLKHWLYRTVYNSCIDSVRKEASRKKSIPHLLAQTSAVEKTALENIIQTEIFHRLYSLLAQLPPRSRQIFHLFYLQNKSIKEIAGALDISVNTVKTQKLRAIQFLKQHSTDLTLLFLYALTFI